MADYRLASFEAPLNASSGSVTITKTAVHKLVAFNAGGEDKYLQLFDTGSVPFQPDAPRRSYKVPATGSLLLEYQGTREYKLGLSYAWSTAYDTFASGAVAGAALANSCSVEIDYEAQ